MMIDIAVVIPLVVAAFAGLFMRDNEHKAKYVALGGSVASLAIALAMLFNVLPGPPVQTFQWFTIANIAFNITTSTLPLNMLLLMIVAVMTPLVFIYSIGFMEIPSEQPRFYFEMCIFAAAMMLFAISYSFITMFIAWEMLGITSYLLIGFWYRKDNAPTAARKAITTILIGDILMLMGILLIGVVYHSFDFQVVLATPVQTASVVALLLILLGAFTKSAQFPFHEWLSDAMEGPTPVSAFLHSSTMVKAGVFLIALLLPLYESAGLLPLILAIGLISAIIGASNAITERHIKKILAYSTIEDLGLMFVALGLNALPAAMLLFFVQTFYKALLFFGAGSLMKANAEEEDIYKLCCSTKNKLVFYTTAIAAVSIAGIFPLSGFFGKGAVESAAMGNIAVYAMLLVVEFATSIYIFRWLFIPMRKSYDDSIITKLSYGAIPKSMTAPAVVLAGAVISASLLYQSVISYITPLGAAAQGSAPISLADAIIANVLALAGLCTAYYIYRLGHRRFIANPNKNLFAAMYNSTIVNAAYLRIVRSVGAVAAALSALDFAFDASIYALGTAFTKAGYLARRMVNGQVNSYALAFVVGFAALLFVVFVIGIA